MEWWKTALLRTFITTTLVSSVFNQPTDATQKQSSPQSYDPVLAKVYAKAVSAKAAALPTLPEFEVSIKVTNLEKVPVMCITYVRKLQEDTKSSEAWNEYHRSEIVPKQLSPEFVEKPVFPNSYFENVSVRFVIHEVGPNRQLVETPLGYVDGQLSEFIRSEITSLSLRREGSSNNRKENTDAEITIRVETLEGDPEKVSFELTALQQVRKDMTGYNDPFIEIFKTSPKLGDILVYRTEVVKNEKKPIWKLITLKVRSLCNGDEERPLKFICSDWDNVSPDIIGIFEITLADFRRLQGHDLVDPRDKTKITGRIGISRGSSVQEPTFVAYLRGGLQLRSIIAIDFTNSNNTVQTPGSLHFVDSTLNCYEQTMYSVIPVIEPYTWSQLFTVLGFGTQVPHGPTRGVFNVNPSSADCMGMRGVLEAYRSTLGTVKLDSEVKMASVIEEAVRIIEANKNVDQYFILLILTDGDISADDAVQVNTVLKDASAHPISIIVASMGQSNFENFKKLDADQLMTDASAIGRRDILQFVPLDEFLTQNFNPDVLEREMLAELPDQVVAYMRSRNYKPKPALSDD